jgi:hypothetical protein
MFFIYMCVCVTYYLLQISLGGVGWFTLEALGTWLSFFSMLPAIDGYHSDPVTQGLQIGINHVCF